MWMTPPELFATAAVVDATLAPSETVPVLVRAPWRRIEPLVAARTPEFVTAPVARIMPEVEETDPTKVTVSPLASPKKMFPDVEVTTVPVPMVVDPLTVSVEPFISVLFVPLVMKVPERVVELAKVRVPALLFTKMLTKAV